MPQQRMRAPARHHGAGGTLRRSDRTQCHSSPARPSTLRPSPQPHGHEYPAHGLTLRVPRQHAGVLRRRRGRGSGVSRRP
ncbi:hypothetical protein QJS66_15910 [Kocuria rhizophila]|nr:hypothetical protein QJS66_15910 [Kocuria rhizophila]